MMRLINVDSIVNIEVFDEEHEEYRTESMTVEDALDKYTNEGCPTIMPESMFYTGERKTGKEIKRARWEKRKGFYELGFLCSACGEFSISGKENYCGKCGAHMEADNGLV